MDQKAFDLIAGKVGEVLAGQGFSSLGTESEGTGCAALFAGDNAAYSVFYDEAKKRFELRTCDAEDKKPDGKWKSISVWLYDPAGDGLSEAEGILNDFVETIQGPKRIAEVRTKKKRKKDDENNPNPVFLFNRFVGVFPELRDELSQEKAQYDDVRSVTFARASLLPKIEALGVKASGEDQKKRCCDLLNDMYATGDMDVRSIITIVLLNGLSDAALDSLKPFFSDDLKKSHAAARKLRGKTIRPEKKKKPKKFVADNLNTLNR